jgi:CheY-like chemotaxis protein
MAKSILLIEDDIDDQDLFFEALGIIDKSITCTTANDGADALEKLNVDNSPLPDLIVLDINMPRMNGKQFLETFRKMERFSQVPVVIYSTTSQSHYVNEIMALGATRFFMKPDSFQRLCEEIEISIKNDSN